MPRRTSIYPLLRNTAVFFCCAVSQLFAQAPFDAADFLENHCTSCNDDIDQKSGFDLTSAVWKPDNPANFSTWVKIHDRVASGEMPPRKKKRPDTADLEEFLGNISSNLTKHETATVTREGRATKRRLNRFEYENTLRDLLSLPYLDVKDFLPEDTEANGFNKTGEPLDVAHVQMARYLKAADYALRQAMIPQIVQPPKTVKRYPTWNQDAFVRNINQIPDRRRTFPMQGLELKPEFMGKGVRDLCQQDQKVKETGSIGILMSTYEPTEIRFGGFQAPVSGRYRLKISANSFWITYDFKTISEGRRPEPVTLYADIQGVDGVTLRPVKLPPDSVRGGFLTQASVLKVTSNGTTTSPVMRGARIMAILLEKPAPPPASVPAVEPDTRGVTTIRDQLAKHRTEESCNACHRNIDPPGFALENFDVMGAWRERYRSLGEGEPVLGVGHNAQAFSFRLGPVVDASGQMSGGPPFADVTQLRAHLVKDPALLVTNLVKQLAVFATGAPIGFSDRPAIRSIVDRSKPSGYGVRTLVHALV